MRDLKAGDITISENPDGLDVIMLAIGQNWIDAGIQAGDAMLITVGNEKLVEEFDFGEIGLLTGPDDRIPLALENGTYMKANDETTPSDFNQFDDAIQIGVTALVQLEDSEGNRTPGLRVTVGE